MRTGPSNVDGRHPLIFDGHCDGQNGMVANLMGGNFELFGGHCDRQNGLVTYTFCPSNVRVTVTESFGVNEPYVLSNSVMRILSDTC